MEWPLKLAFGFPLFVLPITYLLFCIYQGVLTTFANPHGYGFLIVRVVVAIFFALVSVVTLPFTEPATFQMFLDTCIYVGPVTFGLGLLFGLLGVGDI